MYVKPQQGVGRPDNVYPGEDANVANTATIVTDETSAQAGLSKPDQGAHILL